MQTRNRREVLGALGGLTAVSGLTILGSTEVSAANPREATITGKDTWIPDDTGFEYSIEVADGSVTLGETDNATIDKLSITGKSIVDGKIFGDGGGSATFSFDGEINNITLYGELKAEFTEGESTNSVGERRWKIEGDGVYSFGGVEKVTGVDGTLESEDNVSEKYVSGSIGNYIDPTTKDNVDKVDTEGWITYARTKADDNQLIQFQQV